MVQFIKQHVTGCPICQEDPEIQDEILRITEIILPESKIPKAVRLKQEEEEAEREREKAEAEDNNSTETEESSEEEFIEEDEEDPLPSEE
jgi:phage terminase small subunit